MITNNNESTPKRPFRNGAKEESESSRRNSTSSQLSSSTTSPTYDSGNISDLNLSLHPASLSSAEDESILSDYGEHNKFQQLLREKDQSLFLALQDVRKLKSELERLSKSEKWYKSELRLQKNSRMEILEKLYTNERKFTQENQRLQNECISLYARCTDVENQLEAEKQVSIKLMTNDIDSRSKDVIDECFSRDFDLKQHREKIEDQEELINMLRNQKRTLLKDLQKLSCEKGDIVHQLENSIARLEDENRTITKRCLQLVEAKIVLKDELLAKEADCTSLDNEALDMQIMVKSLQDKLHSHITELNQKEHEVSTLKHELSQKEEISDLLQKKHQHELLECQKTVSSLQDIISSLNSEISTLKDFRFRYNNQKCEIDELKQLLHEQTSELEKQKRFDEQITNQSQPQPTTPETSTLNDENLSLQKELNSIKHQITSQSSELLNLRQTKQDTDYLSEKYLEVCKLYEKSKFDLDMKDIKVEKYKFEKEKDTREIGTLRQKLVEASQRLECQKSLATEFEFVLSRTQQEKRRLDLENKCNIDKNLKLKAERSQSVQIINDKDIELNKLKAQLSHAEETLVKYNNSMSQVELNSNKEKIASIQRQISAKTDKINQLNAEQDEWENLFKDIPTQENSMISDTLSNEFDLLNELFDDQNTELIKLNKYSEEESYCLRQALEKSSQETKTFQRDLEKAKLQTIDLENQVKALENENADYQKEIAHLAGINERLIVDFNDDFSRERENHKIKTKQLQLEASLRNTESDTWKSEVKQLQSEIDRLNKISETLDTSDSDRQRDEVVHDRILQNVIETEHRRKMSRYDIHIRSLLSNVKSYKTNLEIAESRYASLLAKANEMITVEEFQAMSTKLEQMRIQFESSQREIGDLNRQLETVRQQKYVSDPSKSSNTMDLTNLMDDYKKLIQQSQTAVKRPSTSEIYKLINKSNNCVPNLTNVSTSMDGLKEDIHQICAIINQSSPAGRSTSPKRKLTLMEELKLAENGTLC